MCMRSMAPLLMITFLLVLADLRNGAADICIVNATWMEGYRCCNSRGLELPAPSKMTDVSRLLSQARNRNSDSVWLQFTSFVRRYWIWIDGDIAESGMIDETRPGYCGAYNQTTRLVEARQCDDKSVVGAICEIKDCGSCKILGIVSVVCIWYNETCYIYFCNKHNWYQARQDCLSDGWTMSTVKRTELRDVLASREWACDIFWVGIRRVDWLYPANTGFIREVYNIWPNEGPLGSGRCAVLNASGHVSLVQPVSCTERHSALCVDDQGGYQKLDKMNAPTFLEGMLTGLVLMVIVLVAAVTVLLYRHKRRKMTHEEQQAAIPLQRDIENNGGSETDLPFEDRRDCERDLSEESLDVRSEPMKQVGPPGLQNEVRVNGHKRQKNESLDENITDSEDQSSEQPFHVYKQSTKPAGPWQSQDRSSPYAGRPTAEQEQIFGGTTRSEPRLHGATLEEIDRDIVGRANYRACKEYKSYMMKSVLTGHRSVSEMDALHGEGVSRALRLHMELTKNCKETVNTTGPILSLLSEDEEYFVRINNSMSETITINNDNSC